MESIPVPPTRPPAPYVGGKRQLAARIIERLAAIPHRTYVEPFVGMGGIFLRRPVRAPAEVINDVSRDVSNLFRVLQRHYVPLMDMLRWQLTSRADFDRLRATPAESLTDLERAARFLYLQRTAFGGRPGHSFGVSPTNAGRFDVAKLGPLLDEVHQRLSGVVIECLPYELLIPRYDRPGTLFYLDPPYWGCEADYGAGVFGRPDFERLADLLARLAGRFVLSLNDVPDVRRLFGRYAMESVDVPYSVPSGPATRRQELIITGP